MFNQFESSDCREFTVSSACTMHAIVVYCSVSIDRLNKYSYTEIMMERIMKRCNNVFRIGRLLSSIFIKIPFFLFLRFAILFPSRLSFRKHSHRRAFLPFDSFSIPSPSPLPTFSTGLALYRFFFAFIRPPSDILITSASIPFEVPSILTAIKLMPIKQADNR